MSEENKPVSLSRRGKLADVSGKSGGQQFVDLAGEIVVEHVQFAPAALREGDDSLVGVDQGGVRIRVVLVRPQGPDRAGDVVAVDERSDQTGQLGAAIDRSADDRVGLGVRVVHDRRQDGRRSRLDLGPQGGAGLP